MQYCFKRSFYGTGKGLAPKSANHRGLCLPPGRLQEKRCSHTSQCRKKILLNLETSNSLVLMNNCQALTFDKFPNGLS